MVGMLTAWMCRREIGDAEVETRIAASKHDNGRGQDGRCGFVLDIIKNGKSCGAFTYTENGWMIQSKAQMIDSRCWCVCPAPPNNLPPGFRSVSFSRASLSRNAAFSATFL